MKYHFINGYMSFYIETVLAIEFYIVKFDLLKHLRNTHNP